MLPWIQRLIGTTLAERWLGEDTHLALIVLFALIPAAIGYLLGSVNVSIILSGIYKDDIRNYGSGNAGMTNVMRVWGKGAALITLLGDFLKSAVAIALV